MTAKEADGWDESHDLVIVGSGGAAVCAALVAREAGKSPLILEKLDKVGGTTAASGGNLWIPNSSQMKRAGVEDSLGLAGRYLDACAGPPGPGSTPERRLAYLQEAPRMADFLERAGMVWLYKSGWADYHEGQLPGALAAGRPLMPELFDMRALGDWGVKLGRRPRPAIRGYEHAALSLYGKSWKSRFAMLRVGWRMIRNRLGADIVGNGAALTGRLFKLALDKGVDIRTETPVTELVMRDGQVTGVVVNTKAGPRHIQARHGVLLNAGGFAHNLEMRERYHVHPTSTQWTHTALGDTGEVMRMAMEAGGATALMDFSWWNPTSVNPAVGAMAHVLDITHPHCIVVDSSGQRYVNESCSYVAFGIAMHERHKSVPAVPSWAIIDSRHRQNYLWGGVKPGAPPAEWLSNGYMIAAASIDELADRCGIDRKMLAATVARFNGFARSGVDEDFGRGKSAYDQFLGDPSTKPNPNLGAIEQAPFYAVRLYPGDVGTAGGLVTDERARVLREDGSPISGLYAAGNIAAPVVGRSYPGSGTSIGSAMVFGYIAARDALGVN